MTITTILIIISTTQIWAQEGCGRTYESDVAKFFATKGQAYECEMVKINRVNNQVILNCDHLFGSSTVKNLKVPKSYVDEHMAVLNEVPMSEERLLGRQQRVFRNAILESYKSESCLSEEEFARKDGEGLEKKLFNAGEMLEGEFHLLGDLNGEPTEILDLEIFDGGRNPKPDFSGLLTGRVPQEDENVSVELK